MCCGVSLRVLWVCVCTVPSTALFQSHWYTHDILLRSALCQSLQVLYTGMKRRIRVLVESMLLNPWYTIIGCCRKFYWVIFIDLSTVSILGHDWQHKSYVMACWILNFFILFQDDDYPWRKITIKFVIWLIKTVKKLLRLPMIQTFWTKTIKVIKMLTSLTTQVSCSRILLMVPLAIRLRVPWVQSNPHLGFSTIFIPIEEVLLQRRLHQGLVAPR